MLTAPARRRRCVWNPPDRLVGAAARPFPGAVAQMGERVNGIHEVRGSIPLGSTNIFKGLA